MRPGATISFTPGASKADFDLFGNALSLKKVRAIAGKHRLEEKFTEMTGRIQNQDISSGQSPEIRHLERELYQYPYQSYPREVKHIHAFAGSNPESEVERLAACIIHLSREKGWRFREMTVVSGDLSVYGSIIKRIFPEFGIPYFIDEKKPVIQNPIVDLVLTGLRVIDRGYRYEDVFKLLKRGFCGLAREQVELLENYCLEYGIRGRRWKEPFVPGERKYPLAELNKYREINPFLRLVRR